MKFFIKNYANTNKRLDIKMKKAKLKTEEFNLMFGKMHRLKRKNKVITVKKHNL